MKRSKLVVFISALLIVVGIIISMVRLVVMPRESVWINVKLLLSVVTLMFAMFYTLYGYKKDASLFYKIYMFLFAANALLSMLILIVTGKMITYSDGIIMAFHMGWCIAAGMLAFAQNMGRKTSLKAALIALVLNIFTCGYAMITSAEPMKEFFSSFQTVVLAFLAVTFVVAKYQAKEARGKHEA